MPLNKTKGDMFNWIDFTWNTVKGECPHGCHYCYMKKWGEQKPVRFDEKELKTNLGSGNFIFVGSSCDMFAAEIPSIWIHKTLAHCKKYDNNYLFQSKNPARFFKMQLLFPKNIVLGTTIETDQQYKEMGNAPSPTDRAVALYHIHKEGFKTMVTIEPIMDFNIGAMVEIIKLCRPDWVNIGANTNSKIKLSEPSPKKIQKLIKRLREITEVKIKPNLNRLRS